MKQHFESPKLEVYGIAPGGGVICASPDGEFSNFSYESVPDADGFKTEE